MAEKKGGADNTSIWSPCPMESLSITLQSVDTVRTLHHTIVLLRTALDDAKFEIKRLRSQLAVQKEINESAKNRSYSEQIFWKTPRKQILDAVTSSSEQRPKYITKHTAQEVTMEEESSSPTEQDKTSYEQKIAPIISDQAPAAPIDPILKDLSQEEKEAKLEEVEEDIIEHHFTDKSDYQQEYTKETISVFQTSDTAEPVKNLQHLELFENPNSFDATKCVDFDARKSAFKHDAKFVPDIQITARKLASKIDIKIKVQPNVKAKGVCDSIISKSPPSPAKSQTHKKSSCEQSDENLVLCRNGAQLQASKDEQQLDDSRLASDSSFTFFDDKSPPQTPISEANSSIRGHDSKEEVDDIELIFSSDENRDPIQEDLVSISEFEQWQPSGATGTPVLVKFSSLQFDQEDKTLKKISAPTSQETPKTSKAINDRSLNLLEISREQKEPPIRQDKNLDLMDQKPSYVGRKWINYNVVIETDISKCGIIEETTFEMHRRNTCPNPPAYKTLAQREVIETTCRILPGTRSQYSRRTGHETSVQPIQSGITGTKKSCAAETEITTLLDHWKSESQLSDSQFRADGQFTLPSKFTPTTVANECHGHITRKCHRTQEARRILLSDINFTSMVPELSRSADHLCPEKGTQNASKPPLGYYKGSYLKTTDYSVKRMTSNINMTSPGASQWTVNENSLGTQADQNGELWGKRGDSFDSCRSYSVDSRFSGLDRSHMLHSGPSTRCTTCKLTHGIRTSESMNYAYRVAFPEPSCKVRGSLPDLRHYCICSKRFPGRTIFTISADSNSSTESLMDEADTFVRKSKKNAYINEDVPKKMYSLRRMFEADTQKDYVPSKQSLPFLPKTAQCLKPGYLAKVISKNGRVVVGRVRYVGPLATIDKSGKRTLDELYVGVQVPGKYGDCDGKHEGRTLFQCEPLKGLFVPFEKVVMAWAG